MHKGNSEYKGEVLLCCYFNDYYQMKHLYNILVDLSFSTSMKLYLAVHEFGLKPIYFPCYRSVFTLWVDGYDYLENEMSVVSLHLYHGFSYDL